MSNTSGAYPYAPDNVRQSRGHQMRTSSSVGPLMDWLFDAWAVFMTFALAGPYLLFLVATDWRERRDVVEIVGRVVSPACCWLNMRGKA